ncbi:hypothetical protein BWK69_01225 [Candidatus Parcubacteria bacterium A4]|nr:MAG: hypothetical protein BWK69_01225 [Candidatus Parcubacteria bacterium A4]
MFLTSIVPLGYIFATLPWHLYLLEALHALGMAMVIPPWGGIFIRHAEKGKEAFCWSLESSGIGISAGVAGITGGLIAKAFGFLPLFLGVSILTMTATFLLFLIRKELLTKGKVILIPKQY